MSTILLVDDNPAERVIFRRMLMESGHTVHELARGGEVLAKVREIRPHVVVLDVNLPDTDGHSVCRELRADPLGSGIPVLMLTVQDQRQDIVAGLSAGADDYVTKDEAAEVILARVARLANYRKLAAVAVLNEQLSQVGRLVAGIVHEIRSPLSVIRGHAELLKLTMPDNAEVQECADPILRSALVLQARLDHLMAAVRTGPTATRLVDLGPILREASELFHRGLDPRSSRVSTRLELPEPTPKVVVDAGRLIQVMLNLLANAHEAIAATKGRGTITISVEVEPGLDRDSERVRIDVVDDGPGIPPLVLDRLFEPFFTTKPEGSGYGLYLAHEIVRDQGGRVEARNCPEGGACFSIWLRGESEAVLAVES